MNKNVLIISSTPRAGGNSEILSDEFARGAAESGNLTEIVRLRQKKIGMCTGCGTCSELRKPCPQKDDAPEIIEKMVEADVIVFATPVYFYAPCAQLKALIDRCSTRYEEMKGKKFYFIATMADETAENMERTFDTLRGFTDCLEDPEECGCIYGTGVWKKGEVRHTPAMQQAYEMGKSIR